MKKTYETPNVEKIAFQYRDQVIAASGEHTCSFHWTQDSGQDNCDGSVVNPKEGM